ncbi:MAG: amidohydrolase family protein [Sphingomonas sp.]
MSAVMSRGSAGRYPMTDRLSRRAFLGTGVSMSAALPLLNMSEPALAQSRELGEEPDSYTRRVLGIPDGEDLPRDAIAGPWREMRAVREKRVIDVHTHAWETRIQGKSYAETGKIHASRDYADMSDAMMASFDRHGIAKGVLCPNFVPFEQVVETSYAKHKDRYILTAGIPTREMVKQGKRPEDLTPLELAEILRSMLRDYKVSHLGESAGGAIRTLSEKLGPRALAPVMDVVMEYDVPVHFDPGSWSPTITARGGGTYKGAEAIERISAPLIAEYPNVKFILSHAGGQFWQIDGPLVMRLLFSLENTWTEISKTFNSDLLTTLVKGVGPERVMYGSDWNRPDMKTYGPYHLRAAYQHWNSLNTLARADLNEDERDWILYKSAYKLLKLH